MARVASDFLNTLFADVDIEVIPDPSLLLAKRHTTQDVKDAHDRGAVSDAYLREVLGIPEYAAPSPEEKAARAEKAAGNDEGGHSPTTETPRQRAARHDREDPSLPADQKALYELRGRTEFAILRARDRLGAKARTHKSLRNALDSNVMNSAVPAQLGKSMLESSGIDVEGEITQALLMLGGKGVAFDNFVDTLIEHVLDTLEDEEIELPGDEVFAKFLQEVANNR